MSERVRQMFADIAPRYDVANSALSFGIHHLWRRAVVRLSEAKRGMAVLDCATGTGDLAIAFKKAVGTEGRVLGTDFCAEMMATAPSKADKHHLDVRFEVADAMNLPYPTASFDIASISFGIRNVDHPVQALGEMARTVRSGGKVIVLEFGQPNGVFGVLYRFYSNTILPILGGMLTGNREAYSYLNRTAAAFPCREEFLALMQETGRFEKMSYKPVTFGIAYVYIGTVT
jgi:demethylmenaquinone methyltransferase / 2-methoxy-6-polyprenyl-1,4-benzoquinol methylase